ncbi:MAG: citrate synthase [Zetaproteobacteria bacterium]|nr:citrate synthase [Pseudobdellovibrionaceae bacterium]
MMDSAEIKVFNKSHSFPVVMGSEEELAIDIGSLRSQSGGVITIDPAYVNTASCQSKITYLDGEKGILRYRGYPIEQLAEKSNFLEVSYLLLNEDLPTASELENLVSQVSTSHNLDPFLNNIIKSYPNHAHPMCILSSLMVSLAVNETGGHELQSSKEASAVLAKVMAQTAILSANISRHGSGLGFIKAEQGLSYSENFLNMMFDNKGHKNFSTMASALDCIFLLHADHEQNCSTSAVRLVGSSQVSLYAALASGVNALWGPLHGGANQAVVEMLESIERDGLSFEQVLDKAKDKSDPFKLMGFGHRVYKNFDPRSKVIKSVCDRLLGDLGVDDPLLEIAKNLENAALEDDYFVSRKLYPNVDFYSGIILRTLGIPTNMFTVIFALGRLPGWFSQWFEMHSSPETKIARPRQIYNGHTNRQYIDISQRV